MKAYPLRLSLLAAALLTACGGGGGGGGGTSSSSSGGEDPLFSYQWHLLNTGQNGATSGEDIKVKGVWDEGNEGQGVVVAVTDDGVEIGHEDLAANIVAGRSKNYLYPGNGKGADNPTPDDANSAHGTAVAGLVAAARNGVGGRGVAPKARMVGSNLLQTNTDADNADAMGLASDIVSANSNSWGNSDNDNELGTAGPLWRGAIANGVSTPRSGKGIVYLFAAGNGATSWFDGWTLDATRQRSTYDEFNSHSSVINVGAVDAAGVPSDYSEPGSNVLVSAPSNTRRVKSLPGLITTTVSSSSSWNGYSSYRSNFGGTSGATPIAAGVVALMLKANPNLSWRDVRWILADSARVLPNVSIYELDPDERGDSAMGGGTYSHKVGFGVVDAYKAVQQAKAFTSLPAQQSCTLSAANDTINSGATKTQTLTGSCTLAKVESVDVKLTLDGNADGYDIRLISPTGRASVLATPHSCYNVVNGYPSSTPKPNCANTYNGWTFSSVRHMGETANGNWTLKIVNKNGTAANLSGVNVTIKGY